MGGGELAGYSKASIGYHISIRTGCFRDVLILWGNYGFGWSGQIDIILVLVFQGSLLSLDSRRYQKTYPGAYSIVR